MDRLSIANSHAATNIPRRAAPLLFATELGYFSDGFLKLKRFNPNTCKASRYELL